MYIKSKYGKCARIPVVAFAWIVFPTSPTIAIFLLNYEYFFLVYDYSYLCAHNRSRTMLAHSIGMVHMAR